MPLKIVVTGPESSGKTTLCTQLSERYKGTMIPEFARAYLHDINHAYTFQDIENIGVGQFERNRKDFQNKGVIVCDTDAISSIIWAEEKFSKKSPILENCSRKEAANLYILCSPDLLWQSDPLRENPLDRDRLFKIYLNHLQQLSLPFVIISGIGGIRLNCASFFINNLFPEFRKFAI
ncbi:MAG: ATP-binding protein [Saprospiraceae bacterium]|nr:ATP-binding protein [Saprospiraceae bacterium]MBK9721705.1 ATP-binding protein [Saprospiraceae bacterium]MBK9728766.1 ATP-binding protein [Saprospiraceae bacterium]